MQPNTVLLSAEKPKMWKQIVSWTVVAIVVTALIGLGANSMSMTPPEFGIAKICFMLSAVVLSLRTAYWLARTESRWWERIMLTFVLSGLIGVLSVESWRWVSHRQSAFSRAKTEEQQRPSGSQQTVAYGTVSNPTPVQHTRATGTGAPSAQTVTKSPVEKSMADEVPKSKLKAQRTKNITTAPSSPIINQQGKNNIAQIGNNNQATINPEANPYAPIITYDFNGTKRIASPGKFKAIAGEEFAWFQDARKLESEKNWHGMLAKSKEMVANAPRGWFTPQIFEGEAYANLGQATEAIEILQSVVDSSPEGSDFHTIASRLLTQIKAHNNLR
jgi:hypothetical protein